MTFPIETRTLTEEARDLAELKARYSVAKGEADALKAEFDQAQADLLERMREEGAEGVKTNGINFVPASTTYGQIQDRAEFIRWAEVHDDELLEVKEISGRVNELVRQHLDDGTPLPPGCGFYVREYISQRAA